jgi:hypothetical protein
MNWPSAFVVAVFLVAVSASIAVSEYARFSECKDETKE